jgi:hypothetical protein
VSERQTTSASDSGPVGEGEYEVRQGDCLVSVAWEHGHDPRTIWDHPDNRAVKDARTENMLLPGDRLHIPAIEAGRESCGTEQKHRFRRKGARPKLSVRFLFHGEPRADQPYRIDIPGQPIVEGTLDGDGKLEEILPMSTRTVTVAVGEPGAEEMHRFTVGGLDPIGEVSGVQERLFNLGYPCSQEGELDDSTRGALLSFQQDHDLEATGEPDQDTRQALLDAHGS